MYNSGDAAEQVVRMSLETGEVAVRLAGSGAKQLAVLIYAILREQKKTAGKARLTNMLRSGKELKVFAVRDCELRKFCEEAKKYGVLYCVLKDNNAARAYFGLSLEVYKSVIKPEQGLDLTQIALDTASRIDAIIRQHIFEKGTLIVDWPLKDRLVGMMKLDIEDYLIDEVKRKYDLSMTFDDMDAIIDRAVDVAQKWFR